jgi:hypothetical protein
MLLAQISGKQPSYDRTAAIYVAAQRKGRRICNDFRAARACSGKIEFTEWAPCRHAVVRHKHRFNRCMNVGCLPDGLFGSQAQRRSGVRPLLPKK